MAPCHICGNSAENDGITHNATTKHICNEKLYNYYINRKALRGNRRGIVITCNVKSSFSEVTNNRKGRIAVTEKPGQQISFIFDVENERKTGFMFVENIMLLHPQKEFFLNDYPNKNEAEPFMLESKKAFSVVVNFKATDVCEYVMPIAFTFTNKETKDRDLIVIVRDMIIAVQHKPSVIKEKQDKSPYQEEPVKADNYISSIINTGHSDKYIIPKNLKKIFGAGLKVKDSTSYEDQIEITRIKDIFTMGTRQRNYGDFFKHLLWYEETCARINLRKYNMTGVSLLKDNKLFVLRVPGLAEKRPSLIINDRIALTFHKQSEYMYEGVICEVGNDVVRIKGLNPEFLKLYHEEARFDVRFLLSRVCLVRMHTAVQSIFQAGETDRTQPKPNQKIPAVKTIQRFFNPLIGDNLEQKSAVEHIVAGTSGTAPYMVFGPPGTGKTVTIVEAILQIVVRNPLNRVMICTDSNMAADHVACSIIDYIPKLNIDNLMLRANSQFRTWTVMPEKLIPYSNGSCFNTFYSVSNQKLSQYRIVITTLSHSAKYSSRNLTISHLFIDEAAQASEPSSLIPISGLLRKDGFLVLAGDPKQLGPVCISRGAMENGLGKSLMLRLKEQYNHLYTTETVEEMNSNYITMLRNNFRSHADILEIPNRLFYSGLLRSKAVIDPLSYVNILDSGKRSRAIVYHAVNSKEQKEGKSPSFFNLMELEILQKYVIALIHEHKVKPSDIGVVTPYIRQMFKVKTWLASMGYKDVEVGTVEAFQGKEKRVIIISTVRAKAVMLAHDGKFQLGFLVDDKRFNVALTRAKAKAIIIGNPACLDMDLKWRELKEKCIEFGTYLGQQQEDRTTELLSNLAVTRLNTSQVLSAMEHEMSLKAKQMSGK